ncbi:hypothetical protein GCM10028806_56140 [Spirosoma terrae]|uniref:DUF2971 domain-containing protein n=1 Tax=Spirosoma terrae TaxID=1968276 RepID=A0A6L9LBF1_9BACT|nr:DUF2971 domain-containing protein [Spirosoma terrae]NDU96847.1 DUF2971 domain-containing protein [Spirosoma terrae]
MSENSKRLSLVAKLLNKGIRKVAKALQEGGFKIDVNPNYQVNTKQLEFLAKKFNNPSLVAYPVTDEKSERPTLPGLKVIGKIDLNAKPGDTFNKPILIRKEGTDSTNELDVLKEIEAIRVRIGLPTSIYKYYTVNPYFLDSIKNGYFYFNRPSNFNDPFDCSMSLVGFADNDEQYRTYLERLETINGKQLSPKQVHEIKQHYKKALEEAVRNVGICCFSRSCTNILMWSHYAYNHMGVCLEFDYKADKLIRSALDVYYTDRFFTTNFNKKPEVAIGNMTFTKAIDWQYEKELRIYQVGLNAEEKRKVSYDKKALKKIIFGMKCKESDIQAIMKIIHEANYPNARFYQANPVLGKYAVELQELKPRENLPTDY